MDVSLFKCLFACSFGRGLLACSDLPCDLEDVELQIVALVVAPENGVIGGLGAELNLAKAHAGASGGFVDGLAEELFFMLFITNLFWKV